MKTLQHQIQWRANRCGALADRIRDLRERGEWDRSAADAVHELASELAEHAAWVSTQLSGDDDNVVAISSEEA